MIEPRVHLVPESSAKGHFNVLRGYIKPLDVAGVKIVGDFVGNYALGLPSEMALLNPLDPQTGMPIAVIDATAITDAHRRGDGAGGNISHGRTARSSATSARAARRTGRAAARPVVRFRRDPRAFAPA